MISPLKVNASIHIANAIRFFGGELVQLPGVDYFREIIESGARISFLGATFSRVPVSSIVEEIELLPELLRVGFSKLKADKEYISKVKLTTEEIENTLATLLDKADYFYVRLTKYPVLKDKAATVLRSIPPTIIHDNRWISPPGDTRPAAIVSRLERKLSALYPSQTPDCEDLKAIVSLADDIVSLLRNDQDKKSIQNAIDDFEVEIMLSDLTIETSSGRRS